jgi:hypothetical protein
MDSGLELVKYRDAGMSSYTYFWVSSGKKSVVSPYFNSEQEALDWLEQKDKA